jgi:hypothetical protein
MHYLYYIMAISLIYASVEGDLMRNERRSNERISRHLTNLAPPERALLAKVMVFRALKKMCLAYRV